ALELVDDGEEKRIVAVVGPGPTIPPLDRPQVGAKLHDPPRGVHHVLGDLARHDNLLHASAAEGSDHLAEPGDSDDVEGLAEVPKLLLRLVLDADARDGESLRSGDLGEVDGEPAVAGQKADDW